MAARYNKIPRDLWHRPDIISLGAIPYSDASLYLFLLTADRPSCVAGLLHVGAGGVADSTGWGAGEVADGLRRLEDAGLVVVSKRPAHVWVPACVECDDPAGDKQIRGWKSALEAMQPSAALAACWIAVFPGDPRAIERVPDTPTDRVSPKRSASDRTQEQEQEQEEQPPTPQGGTKTPRKPPKTFDPTTQPYVLAVALRDAIATHSPDVAARTDERGLQRWAADIERLLRLDRADAADVAGVIRWAHADDARGFWRSNLLSGSKLRKHFDSIKVQARQAGAVRAADATSTQGWLKAHHAWLMRWFDELAALQRPPSIGSLVKYCERDDIPPPPNPAGVVRWARGRR